MVGGQVQKEPEKALDPPRRGRFMVGKTSVQKTPQPRLGHPKPASGGARKAPHFLAFKGGLTARNAAGHEWPTDRDSPWPISQGRFAAGSDLVVAPVEDDSPWDGVYRKGAGALGREADGVQKFRPA